MRFVFADPRDKGRRRPEGHLADVEVVFEATEGALQGLKLVGLAVWNHGDTGPSLTLPARKGEASGKEKDWFYEFLRADDGPEAAQRIRRFKEIVLAAYKSYAATAELVHA